MTPEEPYALALAALSGFGLLAMVWTTEDESVSAKVTFSFFIIALHALLIGALLTTD